MPLRLAFIKTSKKNSKHKKLLTAVMVVRSIFLPLCSDFLSVFEGEPHIVLAVDGYEIHQSAPEGCVEGVHQVGIFEGGKEMENGRKNWCG